MTRKELETYRLICTELEEITAQLNERETVIAVQSSANAPYSKHTVTQSGLPPDPDTTVLLKRQAHLRAVKSEIERFVDSIEDNEIRLIVMIKYIRGKKTRSWQHIATRLGYCAEHTPKRKLKKFFQMSEMSENT